MKRIIHGFLGLFLLASSLGLAQARADVSWTAVGGYVSSPGYYPSIATEGSTLYVAYASLSTGGSIYVKKFDGANWVAVGGPLNTQPANHNHPKIVMDGNIPYVVYCEAGTPNGKIYLKKYTSGSWVQIGSAFDGNNPNLAFAGSLPYITYVFSIVGTGGTIVTNYFNGSAWVTQGTWDLLQRDVIEPAMVVKNDVLYMGCESFYQNAFTSDQGIRVEYLNGAVWQNTLPVPGEIVTTGNHAVLGVSESKIHLAHVGEADILSPKPISVKYLNGTSWDSLGTIYARAGNDRATGDYSFTHFDMLSAKDTLFIAAEDYAIGGSDKNHVSVMYYYKTLLTFVGMPANFDALNVSINEDATNPRMAADENYIYVAWQEAAGASNAIYVKKAPIPTPGVVPDTTVNVPSPQVWAYPNPGKGWISFGWSGTDVGSVTIEITNSAGNQIALLTSQGPASPQRLWDTTNVAPGIYFYSIKSGSDQKLGSGKVVVSR